MTPKFIYFDLGNVLLTFDRMIGFRRVAKLAGVEPEAVRAAILDTGLLWKYEEGKLDAAGFHAAVQSDLGAKIPRDEFIAANNDIFELNWPVLPIVGGLAAAGVRLGILSSICDAHWEYCAARYAILRLFPIRVLSYQVGAMKPAPAIYEAAAAAAEAAPSEIFFMDDLAPNVTGAQTLGWDAVQFTSARQLAVDLEVRGVRFNF